MAYGPTQVAAPPAGGAEAGVRQLSMAEAINEAIRHEMRRNPEIILLGQDIGAYGGTFGVYKGIFDEFGPEPSPRRTAVRSGDGRLRHRPGAGGPSDDRGNRVPRFHHARDGCLVNQAAKMRYFFGGQVKIPLILRAPIVNRLGLGASTARAWKRG